MSFIQPQKTRDTLVVGAGLAGQLLARALAQRGQLVTLASDPAISGASRVAAWMINPVTGIRFVPSWRVEQHLPIALDLFRELESETALKIWNPMIIHRFFQGDDELLRWRKKRDTAEIRRYVLHETDDPAGIRFHSGGWANLSPWLEHHVQFPIAGIEVIKRKITREEIAENELTIDGTRFQRVVFCIGYSPSSLPWKPAKGELLTVRIRGLDLDHILLRGIFVIPLGDDLYRVGATYEWDDLTEIASPAGIESLIERLKILIAQPFEIVDARAAVRPILRDARPICGLDRVDPRFGICNGFGSKAALFAPAVCAHFADFLANGSSLDPELNLDRYGGLIA